MRKLLAALALTAAMFAASATNAQAAVPGGTVTICHGNGDGTYTQKALAFSNLSDAQRLAEYSATTITYHINDTTTADTSDIWPAFQYADQYASQTIPASKNWLKYTYTSWYVYTRWGRKLVYGWLWLANPVTQAIWNNGCV